MLGRFTVTRSFVTAEKTARQPERAEGSFGLMDRANRRREILAAGGDGAEEPLA